MIYLGGYLYSLHFGAPLAMGNKTIILKSDDQIEACLLKSRVPILSITVKQIAYIALTVYTFS